MGVIDPEEYKEQLARLIKAEAHKLTIHEMEQIVLGANQNLPIVRLPEHYHRGKKWFTNLGDVDMCNCGAKWPCPDPTVEVLE